MPRVLGVELIAHSVYNRYVVIECPDDAEWDELPWEEISEAADQLGIPWEQVDDPEYEDNCECAPSDDDTRKIMIVRAGRKMGHGLRIAPQDGDEPTELRVLDPEIESPRRD
jgi:hypothetical protein